MSEEREMCLEGKTYKIAAFNKILTTLFMRKMDNFLFKWGPECPHAQKTKKKRISFIIVKM
jgi:hypothetical protein